MLVRVRSLKELNKEDTYRYVGTGFQVRDEQGAYLVSKGAHYDAKVIQITDHCIIMSVKVDQGTIRRSCCWDSRPYNWAITKWDFEKGKEVLYKECYTDERKGD